MTAPPIVFVNGRLAGASEATIPALDSGFLYGDGLFETMLVRARRVVFAERHAARLAGASAALALPLPESVATADALTDLAARLALANGLESAPGAACRVSVSRGPRPPGPLSPPSGPPTVVAAITPAPDPAESPAPLRVGVSREIVFAPGPSTRFKTLSSLTRVLGRAEAARRGLDDVLFADASGCLAEATNQNLFVLLADGRWATPPLASGVLPGVTRAVLLEAARGLAVEADVRREDLAAARGACLTSAPRGVVPVESIDDRALDPAASAPLRRLWTERVAGPAGVRTL